MKLGVVSGLKKEYESLESLGEIDGLFLRTSGANPERAETLSVDLVQRGCDGLVSFGFAGGISPKLNAGDLIIADQVIKIDGEQIKTSEIWRSNLLKKLSNECNVFSGSLLGSEEVVFSCNEKLNIYKTTNVLAVDMESHRVGKVAQRFGLPFLAIRVILDDFNLTIPRSMIGVINSNGTPVYSLIMLRMLLNPYDILKVYRLSRLFKLALNNLGLVVNLVGPHFCFQKL